MHLVLRPILLGRGEPLFQGLDLRALGYKVTNSVQGEHAGFTSSSTNKTEDSWSPSSAPNVDTTRSLNPGDRCTRKSYRLRTMSAPLTTQERGTRSKKERSYESAVRSYQIHRRGIRIGVYQL